MTESLGRIVIEGGKVIYNDQIIFQGNEGQTFNDFSKSFYKHLDMKYPKFYKMDALCKLALIGSEYLLTEEVKVKSNNDIALLIANRSSSLDSDIRHQNTIQNANDFYPSPAIFVYTLPNITIGEVSIRHQLQTESMFLIQDEYDREALLTQGQYLLESNREKMVLIGWVELVDETYRLEMELIGKAIQ